MSASAIVIAVYVVIGAGAAIAIFHRDPRPTVRPLLMFVLWPFLLPATFLVEPALGGRGKKLEALREEIRIALARADRSDAHAQRIVETFVERALIEARSVAELDAAIASAPLSVRDRLEELRDRSVHRIDAAAAMLEEMLAQLTLLRFAELDAKSGDDERRKIEDLVARIEALANLASDAELRPGALP
jgi:hypothetical protein